MVVNIVFYYATLSEKNTFGKNFKYDHLKQAMQNQSGGFCPSGEYNFLISERTHAIIRHCQFFLDRSLDLNFTANAILGSVSVVSSP